MAYCGWLNLINEGGTVSDTVSWASRRIEYENPQAGGVVAARLSEALTVNILVIEAGLS